MPQFCELRRFNNVVIEEAVFSNCEKLHVYVYSAFSACGMILMHFYEHSIIWVRINNFHTDQKLICFYMTTDMFKLYLGKNKKKETDKCIETMWSIFI